MAQEMCDSKMLVKISGGIDLVTIEGKYHLSCLIKYLVMLLCLLLCSARIIYTSSTNSEKHELLQSW